MIEETARARRWYENAVIYQIYPRSFKDSNGDGIGDIRGIIEKLDYLNDGTEKSLGIDGIWISPVYVSPMKDAGYDISDHCAIDPLFGSIEDFDELVREAHKRGIRVVMDYVTNHTSIDHPWFTESRASKENPKRDWFVWHAPKGDGSAPNNWLSVFGGSAWELDPQTGSYYLHHFLKEQPDLNWENPDVRDEMVKILEFWITHGVDGFRVDAANLIFEDNLFRDNPPQSVSPAGNALTGPVVLYDIDRPKLQIVIKLLDSVAKKHPGTFFITESYFYAIEDMLSVYRMCDEVIPFNFNFMILPWDARHYKTFINSFDSALPGKIPNYVLGNHDQSRISSRLGHRRARLSAFLLLTLRGMPYIYYGEELGMHDVAIPEHLIQDGAAAQAKDNAKSRDPARTPMQWNSELNGGFTTGTPWLPLANDFSLLNVETENRDPQSSLNLYRTLIHIRKQSPALRYGSYEPLNSQSSSVLAYRRMYIDEEVIVILNFSENTVEEPLPFLHGEVMYTTTATGVREVTSPLTLQPFEGVLLKAKK